MLPIYLFHFNLQTLAKQSKRECYQRQLARDRVFATTFAETRSKITEVRMCGPYIVASSAADNGKGGCEVWISSSIPLGTRQGAKLRVQNQDVTILLAQPRRLIVYVQTAASSFYVIVLHAFDVGKGLDEVAVWWTATFDVIARFIPRNATVMCGVDGNCRVRTAAEPWIGTCLDLAGSSGADQFFLLKLARQLHSSIVNTHAGYMAEPDDRGTYRPSGALDTVRCDYILVSFDFAVTPKSCHTDKQI